MRNAYIYAFISGAMLILNGWLIFHDAPWWVRFIAGFSFGYFFANAFIDYRDYRRKHKDP
jgi:hypothetical protein